MIDGVAKGMSVWKQDTQSSLEVASREPCTVDPLPKELICIGMVAGRRKVCRSNLH